MKNIKHKLHKTNSSRLFLHYVISYASVLLLPIMICSFYYYHSYNALKERAITTQYLALESIGEQFNSIFTDAVNLGTHLQLNAYIDSLSKGKNTVNSSSVMDRYYLQKNLSSLQVANGLINDINVYFAIDQYIVNTSSTYTLQLLDSMEPSISRLSCKDWNDIAQMLSQQTFICYAPQNSNYIVFAEALSTDTQHKPLSILCIQIDKTKLKKRLPPSVLLSYPYSFALIDHNTTLMQTQDSFLPSILPITDIHTYFSTHSPNQLYETNGETPFIISYYPLNITNTALIAIAEKSQYQSEMTQLFEIICFTIILCVLLGIFVIMFYSHRNYKPVSNIIHFINKEQISESKLPDEYQLILQTLMDNQDHLKQQQELLKNNYLQKILSGEISLSDVPVQITQQFSLQFPFPSICIIILHANTLGSFDHNTNALDLSEFAIKNVFSELLSERFSTIYFNTKHQTISTLINLEHQSNAEQFIIEKTQELTDFMEHSFQLTMQAGISSIVALDMISDAFLQAENALEYQRLFELSHICSFTMLPDTQNIGSIPLQSEYIINLILQNHVEQLTDYFDHIVCELRNHNLSWNDARTFFYFFYQLTAKLKFYCKTNYGIDVEALNFMNQQFFKQSLSSALTQTIQAYETACQEITEKKQSNAQNTWGKMVCQFIENNYFNSNINLNTIAEHFQISPSYLSKKFREQYQKTVIDYLYDARIAHSLALLEQTDLKIADIANMTGFIDSNAFIRIFKKIKGITPGKYRGVVGK